MIWGPDTLKTHIFTFFYLFWHVRYDVVYEFSVFLYQHFVLCARPEANSVVIHFKPGAL
jgi:hypothetical protein